MENHVTTNSGNLSAATTGDRSTEQGGWQPIESAPRDIPILAWCDHEADPYVEDEKSGRLTIYGAHAEGMGHAETGIHIVEWGGGFDDRSYFEPNEAYMPDWWFVKGSEFECAANPTHWMPLPSPPITALGSPVAKSPSNEEVVVP